MGVLIVKGNATKEFTCDIMYIRLKVLLNWMLNILVLTLMMTAFMIQ